MDPNEKIPRYQEPQVCIVGKASDIIKNSMNGYYYDAGGSYYVPYQ